MALNVHRSDPGCPVDQLTEALGGLALCTRQPSECSRDVTIPSIPVGQRQEPDDKENAVGDAGGVTPSRLNCFKQLRDELTCAVCLDICVRPCTTPCGHNYCRSCLRRNLDLNRPCPKCRASLAPGFALNINTTLWNTIQHLFPTEATAKPLTPPPPVAQLAQRQALGRQLPATVNTNPAAPFRPPRFVAPAGANQPAFSGQSSSRANAAAAAHPLAGMGLASRAGRSVSGPRPQRQMPHNFYGPPAASAAAHQQAAASAVPAAVQSLAELGVRPGRGAGARSRSAERWDQEPLLHVAGAGDGDIAEPSVIPRSGGNTSAQLRPAAARPAQSLLMQLLADGDLSRDAPSAAVPAEPQRQTERRALQAADGSMAPSTGSNSRLNPFLRPARPPVSRPASGASAAVNSGAASAAAQVVNSSQTSAAVGSVGFTASQRALLGARRHESGALLGGRGVTASAGEPQNPNAGANPGRDVASGSSSHCCAAWPSRSSSRSSDSSGIMLDDARAAPVGHQRVHSLGQVARVHCGSAFGESEEEEEVTLEDLDSLSPWAAGVPSSPSPRSRNGLLPSGDVQGEGASSPSWEQLDALMARAMEPVEVADSPPGLPRLRLHARAPPPPRDDRGAADTSSARSVGAAATYGNHSRSDANPNRNLGQQTETPQHFDPDLANNYDGEDPGAADTFFTSPFFDETMALDALRIHDEEDDDSSSPDGRGAGLSPRRAAGGSGVLRHLELLSANDARDGDGTVGGWTGAQGAAERRAAASITLAATAMDRPPVAPIGGAARRSGGAAAASQRQSAAVGGEARQAPRAGPLPNRRAAAPPLAAVGGRDCPIELLWSDSDEEEAPPPPVVAAARARAAVQVAPPRVVSGLRRPVRR